MGDLIAGLGGVASVAFFPSALVILWGIVIGIWLLAARPTAVRPEGGGDARATT